MRTFKTVMPDELESYQMVVDMPRYEEQLAKVFFRVNPQPDIFNYDTNPINVTLSTSMVKRFVDEVSKTDIEKFDPYARVPFSLYEGLRFNKSGEAVKWARDFVSKYYPNIERTLLKRSVLAIPADITEIVWIGGDKYMPFITSIAKDPTIQNIVSSSDEKTMTSPKKKKK